MCSSITCVVDLRDYLALLCLLALGSVVLAGCDNTTGGPKPVASVTVTPDSLELEVGSSGILSAEPRDISGAPAWGNEVAWSSSDTAIASVSQEGAASGHSVGEATLVATSDGHTGTATVIVAAGPVAEVVVQPHELTVEVGEEDTLQAYVLDVNGTVMRDHSVAWASSETTVAQVVEGIVMGGREGEALITATSGGRTGVSSVRVVPQGDHQAPRLESVTLTPDSVDVDTASQAIRFRAHVADDQVGVEQVLLALQSPSNATLSGSGALASGDPRDGVWAGEVEVPAGAEAGIWSVAAVQILDAVGNRRVLLRDDLAEAGIPRQVIVTSTLSDASPPVVEGLGLTPDTVDVRDSEASVTFTLEMSDEGTGVEDVFVVLQPHGGTRLGAAGSLSDGDSHNGIWQGEFTIPVGGPSGTWRVVAVQVRDAARNERILSATDLLSAGLQASVEVSS